MKIDLRQISAGLALAGMTHSELAGASGLDTETLQRILKGEISPRPESINRIQMALEARHVEFGPRSGVALKDDYFRRWEGGSEIYLNLYDEILRVMFGRTDEALFFMVDPSISPPEIVNAEYKLQDAGVKCRFICSEDNKSFIWPKENYRLLPRRYFTNEVQVVYGTFVALNSKSPTQNMLIMNSPSAAAAERGKFNFIWDHCRAPS